MYLRLPSIPLTERLSHLLPQRPLDLYPYMDMGAGEGHSTPFLAPTHVGDGHYRGEVNFIMSGGWDMTVRMSGGEEVIFKGFTVR